MQTAQTQRPHKVWRVVVNDTDAPAHLLYEEPDEAFSLSLSQTHNQQQTLLYGESMATRYALSLSAKRSEGNLSSGMCLHYPTCTPPLNLLATISYAFC